MDYRNNITNEISAGVAVGAAAHSIGKTIVTITLPSAVSAPSRSSHHTASIYSFLFQPPTKLPRYLFGTDEEYILTCYVCTSRNNIVSTPLPSICIIGTASLLPSRPQAAAVASVALVSTGIVHAAVCALPGVPQLINKLGSLRS